MKYPYLKFKLPARSRVLGEIIFKPIIPVRFRSGDNTLRYAALIDSGADFCIFEAAIGEYLGIDVKSGEKEEFIGIQHGQPSTAYFHKLNLEIGEHDCEIWAGFSYSISENGYGILGQKGFFENFDVRFNLQETEIEIKH